MRSTLTRADCCSSVAGADGVELVVYGRALEGAVSGWVSSTENHVNAESSPLRTGTASVLVSVASALGRVPPVLKPELTFQTFRRYCALNAGLRPQPSSPTGGCSSSRSTMARSFEAIRDDESRHVEAFRILADCLTDDDRLAQGTSPEGTSPGSR